MTEVLNTETDTPFDIPTHWLQIPGLQVGDVIKIVKDEVNPRRVEKEQYEKAKAYTNEQFKDLLTISRATNHWTYRFILVDTNMGLRISEMLGLQRKYINLDKKLLSIREVLVRKSGQRAIFKPIPKQTAAGELLKYQIYLYQYSRKYLKKKKKRKKKWEITILKTTRTEM